MKVVIALLLLLLGAFFLMNNSPEGTTIEDVGESATRPFRYASLLAKEPEEKIQIPIRNLRRSQIADTWGAPRGSDRKHQGRRAANGERIGGRHAEQEAPQQPRAAQDAYQSDGHPDG